MSPHTFYVSMGGKRCGGDKTKDTLCMLSRERFEDHGMGVFCFMPMGLAIARMELVIVLQEKAFRYF